MIVKKNKFPLFLITLSLMLFYPDSSKSESICSKSSIDFKSTKIVIKAVENIAIFYNTETNIKKTVFARIDTGATQSSIDSKLAKELGLTKYIGHVNVISANGVQKRPLIEVDYELSGKKIKSTFSIADRSGLNYSVLIGRNDLKGFLIDPTDY
ncbi:MAG: retroviral-like aspartic protease family protein [Candidatus Sericytochromatia bacterium]